MKKLVLACCLFAGAALAAEPAKAPEAKPADAKGAEAKPGEGMAAWKPKVATKKDTKAIEAFYKSMDEAAKKGDLEALAAMHDFPVLMLTDNAAGVGSGDSWTKEQWMNVMKPAFENMPKDMKFSVKPKVTWITDSIAMVEEQHSRTPPKGKAENWSDGTILILKDGKWLVKAAAEGGWGDMMPPPAEKKTEAAPAPGTKTADSKPAAQPAAQPAPAKK
jgi:uncharacterized protein (TIGR02246 family)